jgi:hypothetical protein
MSDSNTTPTDDAGWVWVTDPDDASRIWDALDAEAECTMDDNPDEADRLWDLRDRICCLARPDLNPNTAR